MTHDGLQSSSSSVLNTDNFPHSSVKQTDAMQTTAAYIDRVRALALSFPQTYEDAPWGFPVFKVGANKLFAWMTPHDDRVDVTVKLSAEEREIVELLPWVRRASYVGRYGWVTIEVSTDEILEATLEWIRESYWLKAPASVRDSAFDDA
jgi:predicted DNA-binding protein (MmcQ/YjbR family)